MAERHDEDFQRAVADVARQGPPELGPEEKQVFARALLALTRREIPHLVGGAFAKHAYTGVWRNTKDLDLFLRPEDVKAALEALADAGFRTEVEFEHWLAKGLVGECMVDLIFGTGHGQLRVGEAWFERSRRIEIAGVPTSLIPPEELLVSKAYIAERYRFDGADVLHLIRCTRGSLDWDRVLDELGDNRGLLLWHLILFDFVYPGDVDALPRDLMVRLFEEMRRRWSEPPDRSAFRGTLLDPFSFLVDIADHGYEDRRDLRPLVSDTGELL